MKKKQICKVCHGSGHDKGSTPVVKIREQVQKDGTVKQQHVTEKLGSGCINCGGLGHILIPIH